MSKGDKEMNKEFGDHSALRDYLLGFLKDDDALTSIEMQILNDDKFPGEVTVAENDLIEEYLDGELDGKSAEAFNRHFLASPERRSQLRLTKNLREISAATESAIAPAKRGYFDWIPDFSIQSLRFAALATVLVLVSGIIIWRFAVYQTDADRSIAQITKAYHGQRPVEPRITIFPDYAKYPENRGPAEAPADPAALRSAELYLAEATQNDNDGRAQYALALIDLASRKYAEAQKRFDRALVLLPRDPKLQTDAGAAYLAMAKAATDDAEKAKLLNSSLQHLNSAISLDARLPEPRFNKALCLEALNDPEGAKTVWREYLDIDSKSQWADEARKRLSALEEASAHEIPAEQLESDVLAAIKAGNQDEAGRLISDNRELIRDKYLPSRLANTYLNATDRRDELLDALKAVGQIEEKLTGDPFANEIARFYSTLPPGKVEALKVAHQKLRDGYMSCLEKVDYPTALTQFTESRSAFAAAGAAAEENLADYFIGYALLNVHRAQEAYAVFVPVANYARQHGYLWLEAITLNWIGSCHYRLDRHSEARRAAEQALALAEKIQDAFAMQRDFSLLAVLARYCGDMDSALRFYSRAQGLSNRPENSLRQRYRNLQDGSTLLTKAHLYEAAAAAALESNSIAQLAKYKTWLVAAPSDVGAAMVRRGDLGEARKWLELGRKNASGIDDASSRQEWLAYNAIRFGTLESRSDNYQAAELYFAEAASYYDVSQYVTLREEAHDGQLKAWLALGRTEELDREIPLQIERTEKYRRSIVDEQERTSFFDEREGVYDIGTELELERGNFERSYEYVERSSSRSLADWMAKGASVEKVKLDLHGDSEPLSPLEIRQRMGIDTQIVQYSVHDDNLIICVVTRDRLSVKRVNIKMTDLAARIDAFTDAIGHKEGSLASGADQNGQELYNLLIGPVRDQLDTAKELCIVPSRTLFRLPFAALITPENKPLIREFTLVYAPSASVFIACSENAAQKTRLPAEQALTVGDPAFDRNDFKGLDDLPAAADEARSIAAIYGKQKPLIGMEATKDSFLRDAPSADMIHFAGHYVGIPGSPRSSFMLFAKAGDDAANSRLTNIEISGTPLPKARLVVLAACQTGVEDYTNGEGLIGLSRTFLAAQVPLVVASQWAVDSSPTAELMKRFHAYRKTGSMSTTSALRRAQLDLLDGDDTQLRDPYYWAAFAAYGGHTNF